MKSQNCVSEDVNGRRQAEDEFPGGKGHVVVSDGANQSRNHKSGGTLNVLNLILSLIILKLVCVIITVEGAYCDHCNIINWFM